MIDIYIRRLFFGKIFFCLLLIALTVPAVLGQQQDSSKLNSSYILQININYDQAVPDLLVGNKESARSEYIYTGKTFGADKGFGASFVSKIRLSRGSNYYFNQSLSFNRILSYDYLKNDDTFDKGYADYDTYTIGTGLEYHLMLHRNVGLYAGAEVNAGFINGETGIWLQRKGNLLADTSMVFSIKSSFRAGYALNLGTEYMFNDKIGLSLGIKLVDLNAFIKSAEGNNGDLEFQLRDDEAANLIFSGKKEFSFYSLSAGLNIHFGTRNVAPKK